MRLPPRGARNRSRTRLRGISRRLARGCLDPRRGAPGGGLRRALLRSCDGRAGAGERRQVRRSVAHARARGPAARAARALGLGLVPAHRRLRLRRQRAARRLLPALPAAGAGVATPLGGSEGALLVAAYASRSPRSSPRCSCSTGSPSSSWAAARPAAAAAAGRLPAAVYFGAPYSESLFLLLAVGAFYAARTGRWAWAGACAGLASATRSAGLLLLIPLAMLWWGSRPRRPRDAAWLLLAPLGIAAYAAWLGLVEGDALRFLDVQEAWSRELAVPLTAPGTASSRPWTASASWPRLAHAGLLRGGRGRPVPDRGDQRDAVRDAGVRRGRVRRRLAPPAARPTAPGWRRRCCCR